MQTEQKKWTKQTGWQSLTDRNLKDKAQLVFFFGDSSLLKQEIYFNQVKSFYPQAHILSGSTAGEIIDEEVLDNSMVTTAVFFEQTTIQCAKTRIDKMDDSLLVGEQLAQSLEKPGLTHVFILSDGLHVNGSKLVAGLTHKLPPHVAVTGGLTGDQDRFVETVVGLDEPAKKDNLAVVGFYGDHIKIGYGSMGGWDSFGPDRLVTRSKDNVLYELDRQPALALYKKYLGEQAKGLPATGLLFPLSLRLKNGETSLVRTILSINEAENSMTFAGDIPEGSYVRLMKANFERLVDGATGAANMSYQSIGSFSPDLAVLISCVGRKLVLKQRTEEEIESVANILGKNTAIIGFYSYGEICPVTPTEKQCELHNQTMTITTFAER